jgi:selenocysteine lyase/cysteine desulfurase
MNFPLTMNCVGHTLDVNPDLSVEYRHRFPIFEHTTYINSCSAGALADTVKKSYDTYLSTMELEGSAWSAWVERQEIVRVLLARLLNVSASEIAVTTSATAGINAVISTLNFGKGRNKIVTTEHEFPTIGQIMHAQEGRGAKVVHVAANSENVFDVESFAHAIDDETALVAITQVCFRNGSLTDLDPIIEIAHNHGALVLVDAYQGIGAVPLDLSSCKADFLVGGALKYLLGAPGAGFLFARASTTSQLHPTVTGWFAARDIFAMEIHSYDPSPDARRFEAGTPAIPSLYPSAAGLEIILEIGVDRIAKYVSGLHDALREGIFGMGGRVVTPKYSHGAMLAVASRDEFAHVAALEGERVITSNRDGSVRISPHFYNNMIDVETTLAALRKHSSLLA